jgi:tRNA A37 threonylcarbamoyltransferase TsaD
MPRTIVVDRIVRVETASKRRAVIVGTAPDGDQIEIVISAAAGPSIAGSLLCIAAFNAASQSAPDNTAIPACHLPVMNWKTGQSTQNQEALLFLTVSGGATLAFQLPGTTAQECGKALVAVGEKASPPPVQKLN